MTPPPSERSNENGAESATNNSTHEWVDDVNDDGNAVVRPSSSDDADAAAAAALLDPQEVFNASIRFESSSPTPAPQPSSMKYVRSTSSRTSLYPSLASLTQSDAMVDLERNWKAASPRRSSWGKKRASAKMGSPLGGAADDDSSESKLASSRDMMMAETDSFSFSVAASVPAVASLQTTTSPVASMPSTSPGPAAWGTIPSEGHVYDEDMIAAKRAAYYGSSSTTSAANAISSSSLDHFTDDHNDGDEDMVAMKLAAYEGYFPTSGNTTTSNPSSSSARFPEQHAEATLIEYDVHPSDVSVNAVQAEFIAPLPEIQSSTSQLAVGNANSVLAPFVGPNRTGSTEATFASFEDGPMMSEATAEAWSGMSAAPAAEATVLQEDEQVDLDGKPPARETLVECNVHPSDGSPSTPVQAEFVVPFTEAEHNNPSQTAVGNGVSSTSVVAGLNSNDTTEATVLESGPISEATAEAWSPSAAPAEEAMVLRDDGDDGIISPFDSKSPPGASHDSWRVESHNDHGEFAMMDGEAEVVGITEEVHPSEFVETTAAEAELVGSDFNTAIAVPSTGLDDHQNSMHNNSSSGTIGQGEIIVQSCEDDDAGAGGNQSSRMTPSSAEIEPQEAQATIVNEDEGYEHAGSDTTPAVAVIDPFGNSGRVVSDPLPATPVTVLEETPVVPPRVSFTDPIKPDPYVYSGRTVSAPSAVAVVQQEAFDSSGQEEEWTRVPSFGGESSGSTPPAPIPPPMATATEVVVGSEPGPPPIPSPHSVAYGATSSRSNRARSNASSTSDSSVPGLQMLSSNLARGANNVMETLFGNGMPGSRRSQALAGCINLDKMSGSVLPRTLLPSSVIYSEPTNSWVATVNTNQKALEANNVEEQSKALRAFSVPSKKQATALALAWAPPQMHPFGSNPLCFICEAQFAVFRRASHCRNCGVCVCASCSVQWPSKMLPVTYNIKKESFVNICKACDWLCSEFRLTLLQGDHDKAMALHSTGNINLTTSFANVKGELFYPVHCAVLGGNLKLLKWLVDEHCCPLRSIRISNGKVKGSSGSYTPILTSKGRSLLGIALGNRNIGIVRYLVVDKRMLLSGEKGLAVETLAQNLDLALRVLPEEVLGEQALDSIGRHSARSSLGYSDRAESMSDNAEIATLGVPIGLDEEARGLADSECIICFDNTINCVFTPCGHQICCLQCGNHISRCPVCAVECSPMRVFKP